MSVLPNDPNATIAPAGDCTQADQICSEFESAWQEALVGGREPDLESFATQVAEVERANLRSALSRIDEDYRQRRARVCSFDVAGLLNANESFEVSTPQPSSGTIVIPKGQTADPTATIESLPTDPNVTQGTNVVPESVRPRAGPDVTVEGYEIQGVLGRGGMGVVYKARHLKLKRTVALKMVLAGAHAGETELARFFIEAESIAHLHHPNIVQVYEIGDSDGLPFFALEYVDGQNLGRKLDGKPQPPREAARMAEMLARAMAYAHQNGIIHRDLKPGNILLTSDGQPKITDFGLAKQLEGDSSHTKSGTLMGTPNYMAPEQARGDTKDVGPLADLYALGVILYEMLTGHTPFVGTSMIDTLRLVQTQEPVPPRRVQPSVPADLDTITLKCLQKDPDKRYLSADAFADDLRRYLADQPILARPAGKLERAWRWCRRNPWVASLSAAVFVLLATVAITSTILAVRISSERASAVAARDDAVEARKLADRNAVAEKTAREDADKQTALALKTLQSLITQVVQEQLGDEPRTQRLKIGILQTALKGLEQASQRAEGLTGTSIQATMASAYINMGQVFRQLGQTEEAFQNFSRGHEIILARAKAQPTRDTAQNNLAITFVILGDMSQELRRDMTAALNYYRQALAIREELYAHPRDGDGKLDPVVLKISLAGTYGHVAVTALRLGDPAASLAPFQKALTLWQQLLAANPKSGEVRQELARTYNAIGEASFLTRDTTAALNNYQKCLELREADFGAHPDNLRIQSHLAAACGNFGDLLLKSGDIAAAQKQYDRHLTLSRALADADHDNAQYRRDLAMALYRSGTAILCKGDATGAKPAFQECLQIREDLAAKDAKNDYRQVELMRILPHAGRHVEAAAIAEKLRAGKPDTELLFQIACGYALCEAAVGETDEPDRALGANYAVKSLAALGDAVALGYSDAVTLESEPDLARLRTHPEFQALLKKVNAAAESKSLTPSAKPKK